MVGSWREKSKVVVGSAERIKVVVGSAEIIKVGGAAPENNQSGWRATSKNQKRCQKIKVGGELDRKQSKWTTCTENQSVWAGWPERINTGPEKQSG